MPLNIGEFYIRQPRVSPSNSVTTVVPKSQGSFLLKDGISIEYTGSASTCFLYSTGSRIQTRCNQEHDHNDNLDIQIFGLSVEDIFNLINSKDNYSAILLSSHPDDNFFPEGITRENIKNNSKIVGYNTEKEYIAEVHTKGNLGDSSLSIKTENFSYKGEVSRWVLNNGFIFDEIDKQVPSSGLVEIGSEGVQLQFFNSYLPDLIDLNNLVEFDNVEIVRSLDTETSSFIFPIAPILVEGSLDLRKNQVSLTEGLDFVINPGTKPKITLRNEPIYEISSSNNLLKIRWNSDDVQEILLPTGNLNGYDLITSINEVSNNFKAFLEEDDLGNTTIYLQGNRGTIVHQLRVEDGSANSVLGLNDFESSRGSGFPEIQYMTNVPNLIYETEEDTDFISLDLSNFQRDLPFLGINPNTYSISIDGISLDKDTDYIADEVGNINTISTVSKENLIQSIFKIDDDLFEKSYTLYRDGTPLIEGEDYDINPQGGWITLTESAFPGKVFTISYINSVLGKIENEIILGEKATLRASNNGPFSFNSNNNILSITISDGNPQIFNLGTNQSTSASDVKDIINDSAEGFRCFVCGDTIEFETFEAGPAKTIVINQGSANSVLGFENNQSSSGSGAEGGERSLEVKNPPMDIKSFSAPEEGNTIIIKNNDVSARYPEGCLIKLVNDYYQVSFSEVENRANLIGLGNEPFTFIKDSSDTLSFTKDGDTISVVFEEGAQYTVSQVVQVINDTIPLSARVLNLNGSPRVQLLADSFIKIGNGNANRTLGFDEGDSDTDQPDTFITIRGLFKNTYVAPSLQTTVNPITFTSDSVTFVETPQNSVNLIVLGDQRDTYIKNTMIRLEANNYYKILGSIYDSDKDQTSLTLHAPLDIPVFKDTSVGYSKLPVYEEGDVLLKTRNNAFLDKPHQLYKNGQLLREVSDYDISETGDIELSEGIQYGDVFEIDYVSRRYLTTGSELEISFSYFDYMPAGTNLQFSALGINPDIYYVNVLHGSTLLTRVSEELSQRVAQNLTGGVGGFPNGSIPVTENDESGIANLNFQIGDYSNKIDIAERVFNFYDKRAKSFEDERLAINGWVVGASDGRLTLTDMENSSLIDPPQRLYPDPDPRPFEERFTPKRIPCLDGLNLRDEGSSSGGISSSYLELRYQNEINSIDSEISYLEYLKTLSTTSAQGLTSSGSLSTISSGDQITLYVEARHSNTLHQRLVVVTFSDIITDYTPPSPPPPSPASQVTSRINSAVNSAFPFNISVASVSGNQVTLSSSTASESSLCCVVIEDHPKLNFFTNGANQFNQSSVRSRHTIYTAGASYSDMAVPGSESVHIEIEYQNSNRSDQNDQHQNQLNALEDQLEEWLGNYVQSFEEAKNEMSRIPTAVSESNSFINASNSFSNIKTGSVSAIFESINNINVIDSRINSLNARKIEINRRVSELADRKNEIENSIERENLYNSRYSWVVLLASKTSGYHVSKKREQEEEARRLASAATDLEAYLGLGDLF